MAGPKQVYEDKMNAVMAPLFHPRCGKRLYH